MQINGIFNKKWFVTYINFKITINYFKLICFQSFDSFKSLNFSSLNLKLSLKSFWELSLLTNILSLASFSYTLLLDFVIRFQITLLWKGLILGALSLKILILILVYKHWCLLYLINHHLRYIFGLWLIIDIRIINQTII